MSHLEMQLTVFYIQPVVECLEMQVAQTIDQLVDIWEEEVNGNMRWGERRKER